MKCKNCGAEVRSDARFCGKCGNKLSEIILVSSPKANTENSSNSNEKKSKDENTILLNTNADSHSVVMSENESNDKSAANNVPHNGLISVAKENPQSSLEEVIHKYCYDLKVKRYAEISSETHEIWKKIENQKKSCTLETKYGKTFLKKLSELKKFAKTMPDESMSLMDYRKLCAEKAMECQEYLQKEIEAQEQKEENKRLEEQHKEEERIKAEDDRIYGKAPRTMAERFKIMHENN